MLGPDNYFNFESIHDGLKLSLVLFGIFLLLNILSALWFKYKHNFSILTKMAGQNIFTKCYENMGWKFCHYRLMMHDYILVIRV